jgi:hypothetical protein
MTTITISATTPPTLGTGFCNGYQLDSIWVPNGSVDAYKTKPGWSAFADAVFNIDSNFTLDYSKLSG